MIKYIQVPGKAYKIPETRPFEELYDCEREELEFHQEAHNLGLKRRATVERIDFEYARMPQNADFSERAKQWIALIGPVAVASNFWNNPCVFVDEINDQELEDMMGLHEELHARIEEQVEKKDEHYVVCREQIKLLSRSPRLFEKFSQFWYERNRDGPRDAVMQIGIGTPIDVPRGFDFFHDKIPGLETIMREGSMNPVELMNHYRDILDREYEQVHVSIERGG